MAEFLGDPSIGGLLPVLALPTALPVAAVGISVVFGVPMIVISAQLALGYRRAWLPTRLARRSVPRSTFLTIVNRILPTLRRLERIVRPRTGWLAGPWARVPIGIICFVLAIIITLTLVMWCPQLPSSSSRSGSSWDCLSSSLRRQVSLMPHACGRVDA
jgi:hypothetical protein